jgi:cell shape-determining protein MreC
VLREMEANAELVVHELTNQIAQLSREKAVASALISEQAVELNKLRQENENLKKKIEELISKKGEMNNENIEKN